MNRAIATLYLMLSLFLIFAGYKIHQRITDTSDPNSLVNRINELDKVLDEDSQISR